MVSALNGKMILQCMKCDKFFRSFSRIKYHKALQCSGEVREEKNDEVVDNTEDNPWSYNLDTPVQNDVKTEVKQEDVKTDTTIKQELEPEADFEVKSEEPVLKLKVEPLEVKDENVKCESEASEDSIKNELLEVGDKDEEEDIKDVHRKRDPYAGGVYRPAPVMADSDSEYEAESDDSAPEDDDIESHLGMLTKWNPHKADQPKVRKRKREIPENAKVVFMVSASGQQIKKIKMNPKESTRFVPPHPWIPYQTQVTVEQCCQFLELKDYPIVVNEDLKEKFKDKSIFDQYALPLLKIANPTAHPLTLSTLLRAKWFEVMNTETLAEDAGSSGQGNMETSDDTSSQPTFTRQVRPDTKPVLRNIKVNFNY